MSCEQGKSRWYSDWILKRQGNKLNPLSIPNQRRSLTLFIPFIFWREKELFTLPLSEKRPAFHLQPPSTTFNHIQHACNRLSHTRDSSHALTVSVSHSRQFFLLLLSSSPLVYIASLSLLETTSSPPLPLLPLQSLVCEQKHDKQRSRKTTKICLIEYSARGQPVCVF